MHKLLILGFLLLSSLFGFNHLVTNDSTAEKEATTEAVENNLDPYWYQGKAEVTSYDLQQNRYKDTHQGNVVLIQVTEDFLNDKQVKNDTYTNTNSENILKSNLIRNFNTGIYDYSIMTSCFTSIQKSHTHKISHSSQDWCGQSWTQINKKKKGFEFIGHSYFEKEGEYSGALPDVVLEDELFNIIRKDTKLLKTGRFEMLPSLTVLGMMHLAFKPIAVEAGFKEEMNGLQIGQDGMMVYEIKMPSLNRTLEILINSKEHNAIEGWVDTYPSAFDKELRSTVATKKERILVDYWNKNGKDDIGLRKDLGLD